jgi:hypothetical protein
MRYAIPGSPVWLGGWWSMEGRAWGVVVTDADGNFRVALPVDPSPAYVFTARVLERSGWADGGRAAPGGHAASDTVRLASRTARGEGGGGRGSASRRELCSAEPRWGRRPVRRGWGWGGTVVGERVAAAPTRLRAWLRGADRGKMSDLESMALAAASPNVAFGEEDGGATVREPVAGECPAIRGSSIG